MSRIPLIDIQPFLQGSDMQKDEVALAVDRACRDVGFLVIAGHGVSAELRSEVEKAMMSFFSLPVELKQRWAATPDNVRGYRGMNAMALSKSRATIVPPI
jgi:isopenicillin N synthase-like dioxygenase